MISNLGIIAMTVELEVETQNIASLRMAYHVVKTGYCEMALSGVRMVNP